MTEFLIITSLEDNASMNIRECLLSDDLFRFKELESKWQNYPLFQLEMINAMKDWSLFFEKHKIFLGLTKTALILLDDLKLIESEINPDILIFASRHRSETAQPAFLAHTTGNWGDEVAFGGNPRELSTASAILLKAGHLSLEEQINIKKMNDQFTLNIEVTHHGPTTHEKPLIFMELGSSKKEWSIPDAGRLVGHAILETCSKYVNLNDRNPPKIGIGFGGTHYAPQFHKLIKEKNVAISFICPKYYIKDLNKDMITEMLKKNIEKVDYFIIDWKGTNSQDKKHLIPLLEEFDIPIMKTRDF